jgi:hypothetical protein
MFTVSQLRDIGMVDNCGIVTDFPELSVAQSVLVIREILNVLNDGHVEGENQDTIAIIGDNITKYMHKTSCAGRTIFTGFPQCVTRIILEKYKSKMIDHLLLLDDD